MPDSPDIINNILLYMMRQGMSIFPGKAACFFKEKENPVAKRAHLGYNRRTYCAPGMGAGRKEAVRAKRELPVGARQGWRRRIHSSHAADDEPAGLRPLQRKERRSAMRQAAIWVATRSFSSHTDEGSFCISRHAACGACIGASQNRMKRRYAETERKYIPCWTSICCARRRTLCARI